MQEIIALGFLVFASFMVGMWIENMRLRKMIKHAALWKIADYYGVTKEAEDDALWLVNRRKLYPQGRGKVTLDAES